MSQTAITTIEDGEAGIADMMRPATASTAIQMMGAMAEKRIATARMFPRSVARFKAEASNLIREDLETARSAEYAKPVGGGSVRGPSIRLAELAAMCWGNLEIEIGEPIVTEKSVTVVATAWDLQRNYRADGIAVASILDKYGKRYKAHMVETTCLATASKARRNAILGVIPRAYIQDLLNVAKEVADGNKKPLEQLRSEWLAAFARNYKVDQGRIFAVLNVVGIDDLTPEHLDELSAIHTSIKEGSATVDEFFPVASESKTDALKAKLNERRKSVEPTKPVDTNGATKPVEPDKPKPAADPQAAKGATLRTLKAQIKEMGLTPDQVAANMVHLGVRPADSTKTVDASILELSEADANRLIDELAKLT